MHLLAFIFVLVVRLQFRWLWPSTVGWGEGGQGSSRGRRTRSTTLSVVDQFPAFAETFPRNAIPLLQRNPTVCISIPLFVVHSYNPTTTLLVYTRPTDGSPLASIILKTLRTKQSVGMSAVLAVH